MKSYLMKVDDTSVIVKVYFKSPEEELETYAATLTWMWNALSPSQHPNLLPYQMWIKSSAKVSKPNFSPVFLVRQYFPSNLYDRLSTRPFLSDLEKLWVIYQLMRAVEEAHEEGVVHGDIKPENVMVTSWNWIVLTDFAPYKPVLIPDDDPTDFHYFFDSMGRRRCYVAPERFYKSTFTNSEPTEDVNETIGEAKASSSNNRAADPTSADILRASMDVFSLGCTMAEV
jgi:phosphoinositide-3-kinase, regulatory subunit 4